jgi:hypothetical protein
MAQKKLRVEIPPDTAAEILFLSDRTCCVCRKQGKPIQLHHVNDDPSDSMPDNLAVLCFDCHRETQLRGGFDRKLDAAQVKLYNSDWVKRVEATRGGELRSVRQVPAGTGQILRYLQVTEKSDIYFYDFQADFALVGTGDTVADFETNTCINAFVTRSLQRFRANAIAGLTSKEAMRKDGQSKGWEFLPWDSLVISHSVSLFTSAVLSLDFQLDSYGAGAAHPNHTTHTMNFRLRPSMELELHDMFKRSSQYLEFLSGYCIADLHKQQPKRWSDPVARAEHLTIQQDQWILSGAAPDRRNFECLSLTRYGVVIHFDPYHVGSYAEGKYEVFIPASELMPVFDEGLAQLLGWN